MRRPASLTRRIEGSRILIVGNYRPEEVALGRDERRHPLAAVIAAFKREHGDVQIALDEGTPGEARAFVDLLLDTEPNRLDETFRQALTRRTRGHPLFTVELLRGMQERAAVDALRLLGAR